MIRTKTQVLRILILFFVVGILGREIWQVVAAKVAVDNIALQLSRYLATMQYDPKLFKTSQVQQHVLLLLEKDDDKTINVSADVLSSLISNEQLNNNIAIKRAVIQAARFYSALNIVSELKSSLPNPDKLKIVICGDRFGYSYMHVDDKCDPFDDAGESGGISIVSVSYDYQIGSSLGLNLGTYHFHVFKENRNECFLLGCLGSLDVKLNGRIPEKYAITVTGVNGETKQVECKKGVTDAPSLGGNDCFISGARFWNFSPDKFTVMIKWDNGSYSEVFEPIYNVRYPNGPKCSGACKNGIISITLP